MQKQPVILIVENEVVIAADIKMQIVNMGYHQTSIAGSYTEGIEKAGVQRPDLVLINIGLHGKHDGIDLGVYLIKEYDAEIIYMTGYILSDEIVDRLDKTSMAGLLFKPFKENDLQDMVRKLLRRA